MRSDVRGRRDGRPGVDRGRQKEKKKQRNEPVKSVIASSSTSVREAALRDALSKALSHGRGEEDKGAGHREEDKDEYGRGCPTDRLQFGYSPAVADEAVTFHSCISAANWVAQRKKNGRHVFVKKQRLAVPNNEPFSSVLKLQRHWNKVETFQTEVRGSRLKADDLDQLLDMLASKQRIDEDLQG